MCRCRGYGGSGKERFFWRCYCYCVWPDQEAGYCSFSSSVIKIGTVVMTQELLTKLHQSKATLYLRDVVSVQNDLRKVGDYLKLILKEVDNHSDDDDDEQKIIQQALWSSALVFFFKCFSSGTRKYILDEKIFASLPGEPIKFYEYLKKIRDKHIAHSASTLEQTIVGPILDPLHKKRTGFIHYTVKHVMPSDENIRDFQKLVRLAIEEVAEEIKSAEQVVDLELDQFSYEEMLKWKDLEYIDPEQDFSAHKVRPQAT